MAFQWSATKIEICNKIFIQNIHHWCTLTLRKMLHTSFSILTNNFAKGSTQNICIELLPTKPHNDCSIGIICHIIEL